MEAKQCCATCIHSRWWLTDTGRIKKNNAGKCAYDFDEAALRDQFKRTFPSCITNPGNFWKHCIWPDYGETCPVYQLNDGEKFHSDGTRFTKE